jgi:hypothetical protein
VLDVKPGEQSQTRILATNREAYYAISPDGGPGRLLFLRDTTLMAQPFDLVRLEVSGSPVPVAEDVASFTPVSYGMFSVSDTGTLVYRGGAGVRFTLMWFDASGRPGESFDAADYANPALSPDGTRIAVHAGDQGQDLWLWDLARATFTRLTFEPGLDQSPVWTPDGRMLLFTANGKLRRIAINASASQILSGQVPYFSSAIPFGPDRLLVSNDQNSGVMPWTWVDQYQQHIGGLANGGEEWLEGTLRGFGAVQVADCRHAHECHLKKLFKIRANGT